MISQLVTRRAALQGLVATSLANAAQGIIDTHVHFYDPTRAEGVPWPSPRETVLYRPALPDAFEAMVKPFGVTRVIVVEASPWLEDNQWVLDLAKAHSLIAGTVGHVDPGAEFAAQIARFRRNPLFRGVRWGEATVTHSLADRDALRRLADAGLALDVIGSGAMLFDVARVSDAVPGLRIVIDHLPFAVPAGALEVLRGRRNVFAKVSGRIPDDAGARREQLREVREVFGRSRLMYASNWPVSDLVGGYAEKLKSLRAEFGDDEQFFSGVARVAYGLGSKSG
jgi:L-fuconolactonase